MSKSERQHSEGKDSDVEDGAAAGSSAGSETGFSSQTISIKAQKKIISKLASKKMVKIFIDGTSSRVFDKIFKLVRQFTGSKSRSQKMMKRIVKINIKLGVLYINDVLNDKEIEMADQFRDKFNDLATLILKTHQGKVELDLATMISLFKDCEHIVLQMVGRHLSDKSHQSVKDCVAFFADRAFLSDIFQPNGTYKEQMNSICDDLQELLDRGII